MESIPQEPVKNDFESLRKVTPLSKYLAMILFIAMPFIGGYIGYKHAPSPEKKVEGTIAIEQNSFENISNATHVVKETSYTPTNGSTRVVLDSLPVDPTSLSGDFPFEYKYHFDNGIYTVSFDIPERIQYSDQYADPVKSWTDSFSVHFSRHKDDVGEEFFLSYNVHSKEYCRLSLCELSSSSTVQFAGREWESLGSYEYCDVGQCGGNEYVYRRQDGDLVEYVELDVPIEAALANDKDIQKIVDSLHFLRKE